MNKAIFLDRDGVINDNSQNYYVYRNDQLNYNPDIFSVIKKFNDAGFLVIVISNQGGVSKGIYSPAHVELLHNKMKVDVQKNEGIITDFYYCPHHDKIEACLCRKPSPLLIERAAAKYEIDLKESFLIGDSDRDIEAGERAGLKASIKINANESALNAINNILLH
jgi:D-glycero-D-manno-heptose 1,7-bisphosphate phosphatase